MIEMKTPPIQKINLPLLIYSVSAYPSLILMLKLWKEHTLRLRQLNPSLPNLKVLSENTKIDILLYILWELNIILFLFIHGITQVGQDIWRFIVQPPAHMRVNSEVQPGHSGLCHIISWTTLQEWCCTISLGMSCPTAQVPSWKGHKIHSFERMSFFPFFCLWPLSQRLAQTPQFPPCSCG